MSVCGLFFYIKYNSYMCPYHKSHVRPTFLSPVPVHRSGPLEKKWHPKNPKNPKTNKNTGGIKIIKLKNSINNTVTSTRRVHVDLLCGLFTFSV